MNDLAKPDLSFPDLSFPDLARPDLSFPDLSFPDLVQLPPRRIFVTPMVKGDMTFMGNTGTSAADAECALIAGGGSWKAILGTGNGQPPSQYIKLPNGTRPIVLPSGKQVATDATFFSAVHLAPINETWAMGQVNNGECVWTGFLTDGSNDGANDCSLWTDSANSNGGTGIASNMDSTWAVKFAQFCGQTCHVYCIEQ